MIRLFLLLAGAVLLGVLLWHLGPADILRTMARLGWHSLPILACYGAYQAMRAAAFKLSVLRSRELPFLDALWIRLSGDAIHSLTFSGPFLSEPTKAWLLKRRGLSLAEGFAGTLTAAVMNLAVGAAMGTAGLGYLLRHGALPAPAAGAALALVCLNVAFLVAAALAIGMRFFLIGTVIGWLGRVGILRGRLKPDVAAINAMEDVLLGILHDRPARAASVMLAEMGGQVALVLELAWILRALEIATPEIYPLALEAATKFVTVVFFFMPLQLGTAEGSYAVIFGALGLPVAAGFSVAFFRRFRSLLVASAGLAALNALTKTRAPRS
ncbi:MAG: lysylphosphatidylglycerol synthase domain-containing protein [Vicinamibacterales bacterium]